MHGLPQTPAADSLTAAKPRISVTAIAWEGTPQEKRWTLYKAVTLLGSRRHAQIIIRDEAVARSHAVIVNTGEAILLADLLSKSGTFCNGEQTRLRVLEDGDVVRVGNTEIRFEICKPQRGQVSVRAPLKFEDPLLMPGSLRLVRVDNEQSWKITPSVAIIGARSGADVTLEERELAGAHSVIFATTQGIGIQDLGSSMPLKVNGTEKDSAYLRRQDRLLIGRVGLMIEFADAPASTGAQQAPSAPAAGATGGDTAPEPELYDTAAQLGVGCEEGAWSVCDDGSDSDEGHSSSWHSVGNKISALQEELAQSWDQISDWKRRLTDRESELSRRQGDLSSRETALQTLAGELEQRARALEEAGAERAQDEAELVSRAEDLARQEAELRRRAMALEARCAELGTVTRELDARKRGVDDFAAQYETQRLDLQSLERSVAEERACATRERQELEAAADALDGKERELAEREAQVRRIEHQLQQLRAALEADGQALDARLDELADREAQLSEYEQTLQARFEDLRRLQQDTHDRVGMVTRFGELLEAANEAYRLVVNTTSDSADGDVPAPPPAPADHKAGLAGGEPCRTREQLAAALKGLRQQASRMMSELGSQAAAPQAAPAADEQPTRQTAANGGNGSAAPEAPAQDPQKSNTEQKTRKKRSWWTH